MAMSKSFEIDSRTQVTVVQAQMCISSTTANLSAADFEATLQPIFFYGYEFTVWEDGEWFCTNATGGSTNNTSAVTGEYYFDLPRPGVKFTPPGEDEERDVQRLYKFSVGPWSRMMRGWPSPLPGLGGNQNSMNFTSEREKYYLPATTLQVAYDAEKRILGILIPAVGATLPAVGAVKEEWEVGGPTLRWLYLVRHKSSNKTMVYGYLTLNREAIWGADAAAVRFDVCSVSTGGGGGDGDFSFDQGTTAPQVWGVS